MAHRGGGNSGTVDVCATGTSNGHAHTDCNVDHDAHGNVDERHSNRYSDEYFDGDSHEHRDADRDPDVHDHGDRH